jgi:hypothetical protein
VHLLSINGALWQNLAEGPSSTPGWVIRLGMLVFFKALADFDLGILKQK